MINNGLSGLSGNDTTNEERGAMRADTWFQIETLGAAIRAGEDPTVLLNDVLSRPVGVVLDAIGGVEPGRLYGSWVDACYHDACAKEAQDEESREEEGWEVDHNMVMLSMGWEGCENGMLAIHRLAEIYCSWQEIYGINFVVDTLVEEYCRIGDALQALERRCLS